MKVLKPIEYSSDLNEQETARKCWDVLKTTVFPRTLVMDVSTLAA